MPYAEAWRWQKSIVEEKKALSEKDEDVAESLIILQHQPVYTLGAGSSDEFLKFDLNDAPFDLKFGQVYLPHFIDFFNILTNLQNLDKMLLKTLTFML